MTIYRYNIKSTFKNGFSFEKLKSEIMTNSIIKKPLLNITNDQRHPYIMMMEFDGLLNIKEINELGMVLRRHSYGNQIEPGLPVTPTSNNAVTTLITGKSVSGITTTLEDIIINSTNQTANIDGYNGVNIGNNVSNGGVNIATSQNTSNVNIGNTVIGTNIAIRYGGFLCFSQYNETVLSSDTSIDIDFGSILSSIIYGNPTGNTTLNIPNATSIVYYQNNIQPNDAYDFSIINLSSNFAYSLNTDQSFVVIGNIIVNPNTSGLFRIKVTSNTPRAEACTLFRLS